MTGPYCGIHQPPILHDLGIKEQTKTEMKVKHLQLERLKEIHQAEDVAACNWPAIKRGVPRLGFLGLQA